MIDIGVMVTVVGNETGTEAVAETDAGVGVGENVQVDGNADAFPVRCQRGVHYV